MGQYMAKDYSAGLAWVASIMIAGEGPVKRGLSAGACHGQVVYEVTRVR